MKVMEHYVLDKIPKEQQTEMISVIVTAYNIEAYLERSVHSICQQTYQNLEIILVDDGSTDKSGELCDRMAKEDERIRVIHKKNGGPAEARNEGMSIATGSFIGFVDGDDYIDTDMYEKMLSAMLKEQADIAICRYRRVYHDGMQDDSVDRVILWEGQEALQYYLEERDEYDIQNAAWNKLYRRRVLENLCFPVGKWYEDIMFATKALSNADRCVYLDSACYNYIIDREGSIMNAQVNPRTFTDHIPAYWEKTRFLQELGRQDLADINTYFFYKRLLLFYNQLKKEPLPNREEHLRKITEVIKESVPKEREAYERIYQCKAANPNEKKKMDLFLKSPKLYWVVMCINEAVILPIKTRKHR